MAEMPTVGWITEWDKDRIRPAGSLLERHEPYVKYEDNRYAPLVRLADAQAFAAACVEEALESMKFHPSASHVEPNFRDWFNATIDQRLRELKHEGK